ncbi:dihydrofolate reductase-like isoform X2 [Prunus avium]|uniref:Dihydrofolate reductase-like isoform X2 n=1 Tax=Prunus avium TaxID=42229 RepID=A0A6P5SRX3_PRUAV|nr:dihydrofolate reductase-like isoform X2 [Prunus avium]
MKSQQHKEKKMKILCLHGFRTSGSFLQKQISKWDASIFSQFDLDFPDGIFPAGGKSDIEGIFPPPYYEWFQFDNDYTEYTNLEECITYLCDYITSKGPFDGLLGFSQGATLSGLLLGYQAQGKLLKEHPPFKFFISISGAKFRDPKIRDIAYKDTIKAKSVHFIGAKDWLKLPSEDLAAEFDNPLIIRHPQGHMIPRLAIIQCNGTISDGKHELENGDANEKHGTDLIQRDNAKLDSKHELENVEAKQKHNATDLIQCDNAKLDGKHELENGEAKENFGADPVVAAMKNQSQETRTAGEIKTNEREV